jgi:M6 family metalloprotease-like protein
MPQLLGSFAFNVQGAALRQSHKAHAPDGLLFTAGHQVLLQDLGSGEVQLRGDGYDLPAGIVATADGKSAFIVDLAAQQGHFTLYEAHLEDADRAKARAVLRSAGLPMQLALHDQTLYYADRQAGTLVAVDLESHKTRVMLNGLSAPVGVLLSPDGKHAYVSESEAGRIVSTVLGTGQRRVERVGLRAPQYLTFSDVTKRIVLAEQSPTGLVQAWKNPGNHVETLLAVTEGRRPLAAWELKKNMLVVADLHQILWYDPHAQLSLPVTLTIAETKPFIGSYQRIRVNLGTTGLHFDSLDFRLPDGEAAGRVSLSRDDLSAPEELMLLVGYQPGLHKLEAIDKATLSVVATLEFEIVDKWADADRSPSHWSVGELSSFTTGYTWGGGPSMPQNVDVLPQSGTRNVCILTVDTSGARYPSGSAFDTIRTRWFNGAVGTTADPDGKVRSARAYYEEVSHSGFTLGLAGGQVLSINLSNAWAANFSAMPSPWPGNSFQPINSSAFAQACISAAAALTDGSGHALVDFQQVQTLILVIRSAGSNAADDYFWPQAWGGSFTVPGGSANIAVLGMPDDWDTVRASRTIYETLSHEIGHNLGYPDLYTNANPLFSHDVISKDITNFDLMSLEKELPHMTVAQKMETGWVRPNAVMPFDFSRSTIPLDTTVTLRASDLGAPPAGQFSAAEIRIADGWNYYFEYRRSQATQIGDQDLNSNPGDTADGVVVGTDVISQNFTFPIVRPQVMRLQRDAENENSFFTAGQDYKETDTSSMAIADFKMTVLSTNSTSAQIRIQYGTNGRPDLYIRPWPGGDNWQSPDIEVQNARALADPASWRNVPWVGNANTVTARYRNRGPVTARNVRVDFYVKDYTVGGAPEAHLGSATHDIPPESSTPFVEFTVDWIPPDDGHKCIITRTALYIDASVNPNIVELSDSNNSAQSNYARYIAASSSPAKRGITEVTLHNPFDARAEIYVVPQLRGPFSRFYRLYLEHSSLRLAPGESRKVQVMLESMYGDPALNEVWRQLGPKFFTDTRISLTGYGIPPDAPAHPVLLGGVQINVGSGRATKVEQFGGEKDGGVVRGRVIEAAGGAPAPGKVLVTFHGPKEHIDNTITVPLDSNGYFVLQAWQPLAKKLGAKRVSAHYPGRPGWSPCDAPNEILL